MVIVIVCVAVWVPPDKLNVRTLVLLPPLNERAPAPEAVEMPAPPASRKTNAPEDTKETALV